MGVILLYILVSYTMQRTYISFIRNKGVFLKHFYCSRRFASQWTFENETFSNAKQTADDFIRKNTSNPLLQGITVEHSWEKDSECPNSHLLTFKVQKAGTSTIQFKVTESTNPPSVTVKEHSRQIAFMHSVFSSQIENQINNVITSLGGVRKE